MSEQSDNLARANRDAYFRSTKPNQPWDIKAGTRVAYARYWLKAIGCSPTDPMWFERGTSLGTDRHGITRVRWDNDRDLPREAWTWTFWGRPCSYVHSANLAKPGPNMRFCE